MKTYLFELRYKVPSKEEPSFDSNPNVISITNADNIEVKEPRVTGHTTKAPHHYYVTADILVYTDAIYDDAQNMVKDLTVTMPVGATAEHLMGLASLPGKQPIEAFNCTCC